jgi:hypothetical protein
MTFAKSAFSVLVLIVFVTLGAPGFSEDQVRLELRLTKVELSDAEPLNLVVQLHNTSPSSIYVDSSIDVVQLGPYTFQLRAVGENEFKDISRVSRPGILPIPQSPRSAAEVIVRNRLVALEPSAFIGRILRSSWRSLTGLSGGDYEIRVLYEGLMPMSDYVLGFPVLNTTVISNTLRLKIR